MRSIGIDLGGHKILGACVENNRIIKSSQVTTPDPRDIDRTGQALERLIKELAPGMDIAGVGIGIPGMLDEKRQNTIILPNFPGWENLRIKDIFTGRLNVHVEVENDANCYALGEGLAGVARGISSYVVFTLGTGVGGGIVVEGKLLKGAHGMAGELGHIASGKGKKTCGCGGRGHIETDFGADGIERKAMEFGLVPDLPTLWEQRKEEVQKKIWDEALDALARGIASTIHIIDPEMVVLGGGISRSEGLIEELQKYLDIYIGSAFRGKTELLVSELGNDAAVIGAASLVL